MQTNLQNDPRIRQAQLNQYIADQHDATDSEEDRERLYGNDAAHGLSYKKLLAEINRLHPRKYVENEPQKLSICGSSTGWFNCCCRSQRKSDFEPFGVGIVVYFQLMKYMAMMFLLLSLVSIPTMVFFFYGTG